MCTDKKNCFNCKNGELVKGFADTMWEPGEPDSVECLIIDTCDELQEIYNIEENFEEDATNCLFYKPQVFEKCRNCGKEINKNKFDYPRELLVMGAYDETESPVCSSDCKTEFNDKDNQMLKQQEESDKQAWNDIKKQYNLVEN